MTLLSVDQAAKRLNLSRGAPLKAIQRGDLPAQRVGNRWVIEESDLLAWNEIRGQRAARPSFKSLADRLEVAADEIAPTDYVVACVLSTVSAWLRDEAKADPTPGILAAIAANR